MRNEAIYQKSIDSSLTKKDIEFSSITRAWDKLCKMQKAGKLIFDSAAHG